MREIEERKLFREMIIYGSIITVILILFFTSLNRLSQVGGFEKDSTVLVTAYDSQKFSGKITSIGLFGIELSYMGRESIHVKRSEIRTIRATSFICNYLQNIFQRSCPVCLNP